MTSTSAPRDVTDSSDRPSISAAGLSVRLYQSLRTILVAETVICAIVIAFLLLGPRKYVANALLATISSSRLGNAPALAAALGGLQGAGFQATPTLIVELTRTNDVLLKVGRTPVSVSGGRRLVDLLRESADDQVASDEVAQKAMRNFFVSSADLQTGLIHVSITHRDSALARRALVRLIEEVNRAYREASHAQARAIAEAQGNKVDSAAARLAAAEDRLLAFVRANRAIAPYSESFLGRTRLERERDFAQTLYGQAIADRDNAIARALEETPALIVIDPVPAMLERDSRHVLAKCALTAFAVLSFFVLWTLGRMKLEALARSQSANDQRLAAIFMRPSSGAGA